MSSLKWIKKITMINEGGLTGLIAYYYIYHIVPALTPQLEYFHFDQPLHRGVTSQLSPHHEGAG